MCWGSSFGCAPPVLAGVLGCLCACVCAPPVPRHSWLGCAVWVCVLWLGFRLRPATPGRGVGVCVFVCALRPYPATPGWPVRCGRVCLGSGFGCAPPLLTGVCGVGVCAWARVSALPRHSWPCCWGSVCGCGCAPLVPGLSWLGCVVWACVLGVGFWLRSATPGWGVGGCVFVCALRLYPPLLAGVSGVGVCAWARVSAAPRHSWLGCWGSVCVCVRAPLVPRHSWLGCAVWVCVIALGFWLRPATPGSGVGVCVFGCAFRLYPTTPCWGVRCGRVCLGSGFGCAPPLLAGVLGFYVCLCAPSGCTQPLLAGVCGVGWLS